MGLTVFSAEEPKQLLQLFLSYTQRKGRVACCVVVHACAGKGCREVPVLLCLSCRGKEQKDAMVAHYNTSGQKQPSPWLPRLPSTSLPAGRTQPCGHSLISCTEKWRAFLAPTADPTMVGHPGLARPQDTDCAFPHSPAACARIPLVPGCTALTRFLLAHAPLCNILPLGLGASYIFENNSFPVCHQVALAAAQRREQ